LEQPIPHDIKKGWDGICRGPAIPVFENYRLGNSGMTKTISLLQLSLALGLGLSLAGCDTVTDAANSAGDAVSNVASALDPTTWFGDDTPPPATADNSAPSADTSASTAPDLANLPSRPATTTAAQQQAATQSLAADGAQARYSGDALRAGTEAAAAPPSAADVPPSAQLAMAAPSANDQPPTTDVVPPPAQAQTQPPAPRPAPAAAAPPPSALSQGTAAVPVPGGVQTAAMPPAAQVSTRPPGAEPAVPANTPVHGSAMMGSQYASDAALGFQPSAAPPLDPSINQWVPGPIVARYRQTASAGGVAPIRMAAVPAKGGMGMGGPEQMSGAVTANLDAISTPGSSIAAMNGGVAPVAVVYFPGDGTTLSAAARAQIRSAADQYKAMGGAGSIRVVGHASSRTANMPVERHLEVIFQKSQARANAVAQELIHEGVPAARVLIDAVGDSQPVYFESMPQGEDGNRRAEIFVQS
jgi:outer membrane protein OmpA-like peptidoglycan-associated protein